MLPPEASVAPKVCLTCGALFTPKRSWQKFHTKKCQMRFWLYHHPRVRREKIHAGSKAAR